MATVFQEGGALVKGWRWRPPPRSKAVKRQAKWGWLFLSPWIIGFLGFTLLPMLASLIFTFTDFNITRPEEISMDLLKALPPESGNAVTRRAAHALFGPDHHPRLWRGTLRKQGLLQFHEDFGL